MDEVLFEVNSTENAKALLDEFWTSQSLLPPRQGLDESAKEKTGIKQGV